MNEILKRLKQFADDVGTVRIVFGALLSIIAIVDGVLRFVTSSNALAVFLRNNLAWIWLFTLSVFAFVVFQRVLVLHRRFISGLDIRLGGDLNLSWDFRGPCPWTTTRNNELIVTDSHDGGISKIGRYWENYDLFFTARIVNSCIGVIVRATSLQDYYML